jgi:hypothetical protein
MSEEERARQSIEKVCRIPEKYRKFYCDVDEAKRRYAVKQPLLGLLLDLGLPHISHGEQLYFDYSDLRNISLDMRLPSAQWRFMRLWSRSLNRARQNVASVYEFTVRPACPHPGHAGPCDFEFNSKLKSDLEMQNISQGAFRFRGSLVSEEYDFGASIDAIITEAFRLEFHWLPPELFHDMKFLNDSGLANCQSATRWLAEVAAHHDIQARPAIGLFVSVPYSVRHVWLQIRVGDDWKHADPFFLNSLARWEIIQRDDWPLSRSPQSAVFHLASGPLIDEPMVWHQGEWMRWAAVLTTMVRDTVQTEDRHHSTSDLRSVSNS